jgi:hypothetical protein
MRFKTVLVVLLLATWGVLGGCETRSSDGRSSRLAPAGASQDAQLAQMRDELTGLRARVAALEVENASLRQADSPVPESLAASSLPPAGVVAANPAPQLDPKALHDPSVYVTATGAKYHTATCRYAKTATPTPLSQAAVRLQPCKVCNPPIAASAEAEALSPSSAASRPAPSAKPPPTTTSGGQCMATTQKGARCKRTAKAGSSYCWQHGG